jgi:hypothetical protein
MLLSAERSRSLDAFGEGMPFRPGRLRSRFCRAQFVETLQIEPKLGAGVEEGGEAECCVDGDGALADQDIRDAVCGQVELARQAGWTQVEFFQFFGQRFFLMIVDHLHSSTRRPMWRASDHSLWSRLGKGSA